MIPTEEQQKFFWMLFCQLALPSILEIRWSLPYCFVFLKSNSTQVFKTMPGRDLTSGILKVVRPGVWVLKHKNTHLWKNTLKAFQICLLFRQPFPVIKANFMENEYNFSKYLGMMVNQNVQSDQNLPLILISYGLALKKKNS